MRPHYESVELDRECESIVSAFLKKKYGSVRYPISTGDLTSLIEEEARDLDSYADLSQFGPGVEGVTIFNPGAKPDVKISETLASAPARENRLRTTLAHEFGHVHFHSYLFDPRFAELDLFSSGHAGGKQNQTQVCKRDTIVNAAVSDWMEWQAGHVCGAILMPATAMRSFVRTHFASNLDANGVTDGCSDASIMIKAVQEEFQTSSEAARIRLLRLKILTNPGETSRLV